MDLSFAYPDTLSIRKKLERLSKKLLKNDRISTKKKNDSAIKKCKNANYARQIRTNLKKF
jgi:formyltetrahydrofolate synthetase